MWSTKEPPSPPPLPLPPTRNPQQKQLSHPARIEDPGPGSIETIRKGHTESESHYPTIYFFYGTLMKPEVLKHVLGAKEEPTLKPARIPGYSLASWGQYLALVGGNPGDEVKDYAFGVTSVEDERKFEQYETSAYKVKSCWIYFTSVPTKNAKEVWGKTFVYCKYYQTQASGW
jgi:gamma-glutamylcyclotransferase (GGCT)/AIG2-like uncharacterized protein YtfP